MVQEKYDKFAQITLHNDNNDIGVSSGCDVIIAQVFNGDRRNQVALRLSSGTNITCN